MMPPRRTASDSAVGGPEPAPYLTAVEVARLLRLNPKKIYALVQAGRMPAARVSGKWLFPRADIERWIAEHTVYPSDGLLHALLDQMIVLQGSDDWLLDRAIEILREQRATTVLTATVGSIAGLQALAASRAHVATCHVGDEAVASVTPVELPWYLVALSDREQGLMMRRSLRKQVRTMASVVHQGLRFAARQPSAGTHQLAQRLLLEGGCLPEELSVSGVHRSHLEVGMAVRSGEADVGLGIRVAAERCGLAFVPLGKEAFELAIPAPVLSHPRGAAFVEHLLDAFAAAARSDPPGYDMRNLGRMRPAPVRSATRPA